MNASIDSMDYSPVFPVEYESIIAAHANNLSSGYAYMAVFALLAFEYLITFDREVRLVWGRRPSLPLGIFLLNRYLSILEYFPVFGPSLRMRNSFSCIFLAKLTRGIDIIIYAVWAAFAGTRAYAMSARNVFVSVVVFGLALVPVVTNSYVAAHTVTGLFKPSDVGCLSSLNGIPHSLWTQMSVATRSCLVLAEALVIAVTWITNWMTVRAARQNNIPMSLTALVLRDGSLYFVILLSFNMVQLISDFKPTFGNASVSGVSFLNVVTSILVSRYYFHLDALRITGDHSQPVPGVQSSGSAAGENTTLRFAARSSHPTGDSSHRDQQAMGSSDSGALS